MEIASVETVTNVVVVDEDEPMTKKSKQQLEDDEIETVKAKVLEENIQPQKLKVVELRNQLKDRGLDSRGVKTELVERLKAALEGKHAAGQGAAGKHAAGQEAELA